MRNVAFGVIGVSLLGIGIWLFMTQKAPVTNNVTAQSETVIVSGQSELPKTCSGIALKEITEGPYYTADSPEQQIISEKNTPTIPLVLEGYVFDTDCKPIAHAWIDFWQANGEGVYDNVGYTLRGHQYTDEKGKYHLLTVVPGEYPGRTEHIHFKIRASDKSKIITSQLFLPEGGSNTRDVLFDESLVITLADDPNGPGKRATYNFVVER